MMKHIKQRMSLSFQMAAAVTVLVILTAAAAAMPAVWLISNQLDRQAEALLDQSSQTAQALILNKQSDLTNLALLTAQRPTLQRLTQESDLEELDPYLHTLKQGAGLDVILLCGSEDEIILQVGHTFIPQVCRRERLTGFYHEDNSTGGWLLASQPIPNISSETYVVVGFALNDRFLGQLRGESRVELILLFEDIYGAASIPNGRQAWNDINASFSGGLAVTGRPILAQVDDPNGAVTYYASRMPYRESALSMVILLPASDVVQLRQQLTWLAGGGILVVIILSTALGVQVTRRIGRPLERLRDSAENLRQGDLATPVRIDTAVRELALLSYALEDARVALNHTLTELRREKAWTDHLLESVVEGILTLDRNMQITFFSHGAEQITGWNQKEVLGCPVDEVFPLADEGDVFSRRLPAPGGTQKISVRLRSGKPAALAITGARLGPPQSGKGDIVLVLRDVTNEEAIRRLLGDFLANISHEFRTPLTALAASSELILDQLPDLEMDELEELLNNIHLGILSLQTLIDNLLEGASIETGRFRVYVQPSDLPEILNEAVRIMRPLADKYGVEIAIRLPEYIPTVNADTQRTTQVMLNLLSNAIKWGAPGHEALVSATVTGDCVEVSVADRGRGIPDDQQAGLFHPFTNLKTGNRPQQGTGLGLSVVKVIVEAQGGQVGQRPNPGGGVVFWFTLRVAAPACSRPDIDGPEAAGNEA